MTSLLGGVRNSPNLSAGSAPTPSPRGEQNKWPGSGSRAAVQEVAVVVESDRRRERKWAREPGARRGPAPRCHPPPCGLGPPSRAAPRSLPYAGLPSGDPAAAPLPPRSERGLGRREGRGKGRDEAQGGAAEGTRKIWMVDSKGLIVKVLLVWRPRGFLTPSAIESGQDVSKGKSTQAKGGQCPNLQSKRLIAQ